MAVADFGGVDQHRHLAGLGDDDHKQYSLIAQNTLANRPAPGRAGRLYLATDEGRLYYDDGAAWRVALKPESITGTQAGNFARHFLFGGNP